MDEEKLHSQLNSRINEVFDNYQDTTADEGWALLRQKFPVKEKERGLVWLWYAAAAVLLLGIGLWFVQKPVNKQTMVAKIPKAAIYPNQTPKQPFTRDTMVNKTQNQVAKTTASQSKLNHTTITAKAQQVQMAHQAKSQGNPPASTLYIVLNSPSNLPPKVVVTVPGIRTDSMTDHNALADIAHTGQTKDTPIVRLTDSLKNADSYAANQAGANGKAASAEALNKLLAEKVVSTSKVTKKIGKKTSISVYAATYFNYAQGSDNLVNVGAGFSSDFKITNKIKLSTGLSIGQNSLNYGKGQPSGGGNVYADASPASTALYNVSATSGTAAFSAAPVLNSYKASLIGLDIPINIKYLFDPQKSDTFISAGLSSGTFINETYVLNYTYARGNQQSTTRNSFSGLDLAKTLNFSFGLGYPLGKSNRLIVEPFLKYPLGGLGAQQIKFGSGGINLKLNFKPVKK